jgi:hypothetical protein
MENESLRVELLPQFGGKIWTLEYRPSGRQFLWHHPRHRLRALPLGANYDDHFFGGFDELLPNDMPERVSGESLVDHGELWTAPLDTRVDGECVILSGVLPITPVRYQKALRLIDNRLLLDYDLTNISHKPRDLLWKLHPALRISEGAEVIVPARTARVADPDWSRVKDCQQFEWASRSALHRVPSLAARETEFLYLSELAEGVCALQHREERWAFRMIFPKEIFASVWIFASFGGWRDLELLILEPCTTPQLSLAESARGGACLHLEPGQKIHATVAVEVS